MTTPRIVLFKQRMVCTAVSLVAVCVSAVASGAEPQSATSDLDQQLLESLSGDLLPGLDPVPRPEAAAKSADPSAGDAASETSDEPSSRGMGASANTGSGSDVGDAIGDPLSKVAHHMRDVEGRLRQGQVSRETQQVQSRIVEDLNSLIEQLKAKQGESSPSDQSQANKSSRPKASSSASSLPKTASQEGASRESTSRQTYDPQNNSSDDRADVDDFAKQLWGDLPERAREQMLNSSVEQFLPQYQDMIRQYFRRLVEEDTGSR